MITLLARLSLIAMETPTGTSEEDIAFTIYQEWMSHCLDLATQDRVHGYGAFVDGLTPKEQENFGAMSVEEKNDFAFAYHLRQAKKLHDFALALLASVRKEDDVSEKLVLQNLDRYIKITPEPSEI
jgi:hypothetical protein